MYLLPKAVLIVTTASSSSFKASANSFNVCKPDGAPSIKFATAVLTKAVVATLVELSHAD